MKRVRENIKIHNHSNKILDFYLEGLSAGIIDIETTGLNPAYSKVILAGILPLNESPNCYIQYFAENKNEEKDLLEKYVAKLNNYDVLITYNGNSFDIPFLQSRLLKHGIDYNLNKHWGLDLYKAVHKHSNLRDLLPDLKQKTIEKFLGTYQDRKDEISGGESVNLYNSFLKNPDDTLADIILLHNKDDLSQLASIIRILDKLDLHKIFFHEGFTVKEGNSAFINKKIQMKKGQLLVEAFGLNIPSDFYSFKSVYQATYVSDKLSLIIPYENINNSYFVDLESFSIDKEFLEQLPAFASNYLILKEKGTSNYHEINSLIRLVEREILRNSTLDELNHL